MRNIARYNRGAMLLDIQNQRNHYKLVLNPRKSMRISDQANCKLSLSLNQNKYEKSIRKNRQTENQRLYKALQSIKSGKGVMQLMSQKARKQQQNPKRATLTTQFRILQKKRQLKKGNQRIVQKISLVRPKIGNSFQWNEHYENYQKQIKKISRATQNVFNAGQKEQLKSLFRETIDFHRSRTSKDRCKRSTIRSKDKKSISQKSDKHQNVQNLQDLTEQQINLLQRQKKVVLSNTQQKQTARNKQSLIEKQQIQKKQNIQNQKSKNNIQKQE